MVDGDVVYFGRWWDSSRQTMFLFSLNIGSQHVLVRAHIFLSLTGRKRATERKPLRVQLNDENAKNIFREREIELVNREYDNHPEVALHDF